MLLLFSGVLRKNIRTRAVFKEIPSYISIERLWNVEIDKITFSFAESFLKTKEDLPIAFLRRRPTDIPAN